MLDGLAHKRDTGMARRFVSSASTIRLHRPLTALVLTLLSGASLGAFGAALGTNDRGMCYLVALVGGFVSAALAGQATVGSGDSLRGAGVKTQLLLGFFTLCLLVLGGLAVLLSGVSIEHWMKPPK